MLPPDTINEGALPPADAEIFDLNRISDPAIRQEYRTVLDRGERLSSSFARTLGRDRRSIQYRYIEAPVFNAAASAQDDHYLIELHNSVPLFLLMLFSRLLSDPDVMPELEPGGEVVSKFTLPAVIDPADFQQRAEWDIELNRLRSFAAGTLADLCATFVLCHEAGHVICGHVDALPDLEGQTRLLELVSREEISPEALERRQAWEFDADAIAASLTMNFVDELLVVARQDERSRAVFGAVEDPLGKILSLSMAALFGFFCYLKGSRDDLDVASTHPHPLIRSAYIRSMVVTEARRRWNYDPRRLEALMNDQQEIFADSLERLGLIGPAMFRGDHSAAIETGCDRMRALQIKHRPSTARWSWIEWE